MNCLVCRGFSVVSAVGLDTSKSHRILKDLRDRPWWLQECPHLWLPAIPCHSCFQPLAPPTASHMSSSISFVSGGSWPKGSGPQLATSKGWCLQLTQARDLGNTISLRKEALLMSGCRVSQATYLSCRQETKLQSIIFRLQHLELGYLRNTGLRISEMIHYSW